MAFLRPSLPISRRQALAWGAGAASLCMAQLTYASGHQHRRPIPGTLQLAAAWEQTGGFHLGVLAVPAATAPTLQVLTALELPTRAHGMIAPPDGSVLAVARRPGDWLVRWQPGNAQAPQWHWIEPARAFNGHVLASPDGQRLYTTETDLETGASLVGVRDARSLEKLDEWPTHGVDAHELIWDSPQGNTPASLIVANGGVPTSADTGRSKRDLHTMDSSLVRLQGDSGALLGQWRLSDQRLSLRHLAWNTQRNVLGIALQAEHDQEAERSMAPVLALFDGQALHTGALAPLNTVTATTDSHNLHGYGGSIAATRHGWAVSCPRAQGVAHFGIQGQWQGLVPLPEACALAVYNTQVWAAGRRHSLQDILASTPLLHPHSAALAQVRLDNHWVVHSGISG